jgi:hypothetical protein
MLYSSDQDDRTPGASHPDGLLWDFGPDTLKTWDQLGAVRQRALQTFSPPCCRMRARPASWKRGWCRCTCCSAIRAKPWRA